MFWFQKRKKKHQNFGDRGAPAKIELHFIPSVTLGKLDFFCGYG